MNGSEGDLALLCLLLLWHVRLAVPEVDLLSIVLAVLILVFVAHVAVLIQAVDSSKDASGERVGENFSCSTKWTLRKQDETDSRASSYTCCRRSPRLVLTSISSVVKKLKKAR